MKSVILDVPSMYGDHHVVEVRRLLLEEQGVDSVNASSAFRVVEVKFDPDRVSEDALRGKLEEAGYAGDLEIPLESRRPALEAETREAAYFRHSEAFETVGNVISFGQQVTISGRPLWPCPGMGPIRPNAE